MNRPVCYLETISYGCSLEFKVFEVSAQTVAGELNLYPSSRVPYSDYIYDTMSLRADACALEIAERRAIHQLEEFLS